MFPGTIHSVLIVEDERIVAKDLQQTLAAMGYDAFAIASSADEAISRASEKCPDLVLMDIRIKGNRDGIETAAVLRARFGVPIIYLTAHADDATIERAKQTVPYGYLMKPVKSAELRSAIEVSIYRHGIEKQLRERERWFATTLRSIADAVVAVDLAGDVRFMNPAAEALIGVTADAAIGRPGRDVIRLLDPEQAPSVLERVLGHQTRGTGTAIDDAPIEHEIRGGRIISETAAAVIDDGHPLGAVVVLRDITRQKLLDRQLELADRLASLGTMAKGLAHEVNNPLAIVLANASFVLEDLRRQHAAGGPQGLDELIHAQSDLESAANRIARIVAELGAFSQPAQPGGRDADVGAAVAWAMRSTAHEMRQRATVVTNLAKVRPVMVDETRLAQILVNLLLNAAQAIAPGRAGDNTVAIAASELGDSVVIEVRDTGTGMTPQTLSRAFEPFYTTKPVGSRLGLGLASCHGIVTSAGGRIEVDSQVGVGSTFRVVLPAAPRKVWPGVASPAPRTPRRRILVIDDEPMVLKTMKRMLSEHDVVLVDDPRQAVALIARDPFDLIFSDLMMPHMTGMDIYERLVVDQPAAAERIVFLTGGAANARVADFLAAVPNVCLTKPFPAEELRAFVHQRFAHR